MEMRKIIVCAVKGTPPAVPGTEPAFVKCSQCGADLVMAKVNLPMIQGGGFSPVCRPCGVKIADDGGDVVVGGKAENALPFVAAVARRRSLRNSAGKN